jgi:hypothetical protein
MIPDESKRRLIPSEGLVVFLMVLQLRSAWGLISRHFPNRVEYALITKECEKCVDENAHVETIRDYYERQAGEMKKRYRSLAESIDRPEAGMLKHGSVQTLLHVSHATGVHSVLFGINSDFLDKWRTFLQKPRTVDSPQSMQTEAYLLLVALLQLQGPLV